MDHRITSQRPAPNADERLTTEKCLPGTASSQAPTGKNRRSGSKEDTSPYQSLAVGLIAVCLSAMMLASLPTLGFSLAITGEIEPAKFVAFVLLASKVIG